MMANENKRGARALTLVEVLVTIAIIGVLAFLLLPALSGAKKASKRVNCVNHLKQVGLGLRMWASDNNDQFPMQVSTNQGGSLEWVGTKETYRHFMAASNEFGTPKILVCPQDFNQVPARSFAPLRNRNVSYFVNLLALENQLFQLLSGDRHLARNGIQYTNGSYLFPTQQVLTWGLEPHKNTGNIALTDGSVQQTSDETLQSAILNAQSPTNWLAFP